MQWYRAVRNQTKGFFRFPLLSVTITHLAHLTMPVPNLARRLRRENGPNHRRFIGRDAQQPS